MTPTYSRDDCEAIVRHLWPYLDGRLPHGEHALIAGHLAACRACAAHFEFARAFLDALHAAQSELMPSDGLRERVLAALATEGFRA